MQATGSSSGATDKSSYLPRRLTPRMSHSGLPSTLPSLNFQNVEGIIEALKIASGPRLWDNVPAELKRITQTYRLENAARCPCPQDCCGRHEPDLPTSATLPSPACTGDEEQLANSQDPNFELDIVTLLRALKAYCYPTKQISFQRFTWLNVLNILLYEDELMALDVAYATNPGLVLCPLQRQKLRTLLSEYSTFPKLDLS